MQATGSQLRPGWRESPKIVAGLPASKTWRFSPLISQPIAWRSIDSAPKDRELLLWVHGPFIGRWLARYGGQWFEKTSGIILEPVRYWAELNSPASVALKARTMLNLSQYS